jgi:hypothetical protein
MPDRVSLRSSEIPPGSAPVPASVVVDLFSFDNSWKRRCSSFATPVIYLEAG